MAKKTSALERTLSTIAAVGLIAMMLHTIVHALARHLFGAPLTGTNELVAFWYMPIVTLIGFVAAQWRGEHISVTLIVDRLRERNAYEYLFFGRVLAVLLAAGFSWFGLLRALDNTRIGATAGTTSIPIWPVTFMVPAAFGVLAVLYVRDVIRRDDPQRPLQDEPL